MLDKKKLHFWQLVFVFGAITIFALLYNYGYSYEKKASMMNTTMGNMMGSMHLNNMTINDLIRQQEHLDNVTGQSQSQNHNSHHGENNNFLKTTHYLTTVTIVLLLPFIMAGTVFLAIMWFK